MVRIEDYCFHIQTHPPDPKGSGLGVYIAIFISFKEILQLNSCPAMHIKNPSIASMSGCALSKPLLLHHQNLEVVVSFEGFCFYILAYAKFKSFIAPTHSSMRDNLPLMVDTMTFLVIPNLFINLLNTKM